MLPLARAFILRRLRKPQPTQSAEAFELTLALLGATTRLFLVAVAVWLSLRWLEIPAGIDHKLGIALQVIAWFQFGLWGATLVTHFVRRRQAAVAAGEGAASLNILRFVGVLMVWAVALLMLLTNLGVKIGPLIAGLGIGGVAIALAVQNVLGDLFASLSIALDKPFKLGDFLVVGEEKGTVEQIGIKSTRLRSLSGEHDRDVEWRPAEEPRAQFRLALRAPRRVHDRHRLRDATRADPAGVRPDRGSDPRPAEDALRAIALRELRRIRADL